MTNNSAVVKVTSVSEATADSLPPAAIEADTSTIITVDDDGNGDFLTIAEAIAQAGESSTITVTGGEDNVHTENDIVINRSISITGDGDATIDAASEGRVFNIQDDDASTQQQVTLSGLKITAGSNDFGGGIFNAESLTLESVTLTNNTSGFGSGLYNAGAATIKSSTIANNTGPSGEGAFNLGGGIFNAANATLRLENSTVAANEASIGGGIYSQGVATDAGDNTDSTDNIDDALIIEADEAGSNLKVYNSTIANNEASVDGAGIYTASSAYLFSTIVADNLNSDATGNDLAISESGSITADSSLIESNADLLSAASTNNLTGVEPRLDPNGLQDNGGATQTIALLSDSPAKDSGVSDSLVTDQRGAGFSRVVGAAADIGAFELSEDGNTDEPRSFRTDEDTSLTLTRSQLLGDSNDDERQISINMLSALGATITDNNNGTFTYSPVAATELQSLSSNASATDSFKVNVEGEDAETTIEIQVSGLNDAPTFTSSPAFSVVENVLDIGSVVAADVDSQNVTYSVEGADADALTINAETGLLKFKQAPDFEGDRNSFIARVIASDGEGTTGQDITIAVTDVDDTDNTDDRPLSASFTNFDTNADDTVTRLTFGFGGSPALSGSVNVSFDSDAPEADASFDNLLGFYEIADADGGIDTNGDGVADVLIGDAGYAEAALNNRIDALTLRAGRVNTNVSDMGNVSLAGDRQFAAMVLANGGEQGFDGFIAAENAETDGVFNDAGNSSGDQVVYFSFLGANPDGANHLKHLGNNVFGFEDMSSNFSSDNDFNDAIFKLDFAA